MRGEREKREYQMARKLHIGGKIKAHGWEIFDAIDESHVDHVGNAKDLSRFEDGTFVKIYASHVIEHFDYANEIAPVLQEWKRVLRPRGQIYLSAPDLDILAEIFIDKSFSTEDRFGIMRMIFGGHMTPYDYHLVGLNAEFLCCYLKEAGFTHIRRVDSFRLFNDTSQMVFRGRPISVNMTATKEE